MKRRYVLMFVGLACVAFLMAAAVARANDIPGVPIPASPVQGYLDNSNWSGLHVDDVYSVSMRVGDRLHLVLNAASSTNGYYFVQLFAPGSMGVTATKPLAATSYGSYPQTLDYTATVAGLYYVDVEVKYSDPEENTFGLDNDVAGAYSLAWSCMSPTMAVITTRTHTVHAGSSVAVSGALKHGVDGTGIAHAVMLLQSSPNGTSWSKVSTATTNATGGFTFKVKATRSRYYHAVFAGTSSLIASKSISIRIKTRH